MHFIFRANAGAKIGGGHVYRCLALANACHKAGHSVDFFTNLDALEIVPSLSQFQDSHFVVPDGMKGIDEVEYLIRRSSKPIDVAIIDNYGWSADMERMLRANHSYVVSLDDNAHREYGCDLILNQNLGMAATDYMGKVNEDCNFLLGPDYSLLRPDFSMAREQINRDFQQQECTIFLNLGAGRFDDRYLAVLAGLENISATFQVVMLAPGFPRLRLDESALSPSFLNRIELITEVCDPIPFMAKAHFAIGAAGSTSWERCCLGLPSVVVVLAENQKRVAEALDKAGAAIVIDGGDISALPQHISPHVERLVTDWTGLSRMSERAFSICDGNGVSRVVGAIQDTMAHVTLRNIEAADVKQLYDWQCDPGTRKYSRNKSVPTWDEHSAWFAEKMRDEEGQIYICQKDGLPIGVIRLDKMTEPVGGGEISGYEISIIVSPENRHRGLGLALLKAARVKHPEWTFYAFIYSENSASTKLFKREGYVQINQDWHVSTPEQSP